MNSYSLSPYKESERNANMFTNASTMEIKNIERKSLFIIDRSIHDQLIRIPNSVV